MCVERVGQKTVQHEILEAKRQRKRTYRVAHVNFLSS